jgi:hypothetical protein
MRHNSPPTQKQLRRFYAAFILLTGMLLSKLIVDLHEKDRLHPSDREDINATLSDCRDIIGKSRFI